MSRTCPRLRAWPAIAVLTGACGPEAPVRAELDEVCGRPAPLRLIELDPTDPLADVSQIAVIDGRRIVRVSHLRASPPGPWYGDELRWSEREHLWSVGECGESPQLLSDDLGSLRYYPDVRPDLVFGCHQESGEMFVHDPQGARPPSVVFTLEQCSGVATPHGIVSIDGHDEETGALVLQRWPEDPWAGPVTRQVLLDPVRLRGGSEITFAPADRAVLSVFDDEVFVVTEDDELTRVSLLDGSREVEATGVRAFVSSGDGRWLLWQDVEPISGGEVGAGAVYLRDRSSGVDTHVDDVAVGSWSIGLQHIDDGLIGLPTGIWGQDPTRYWSWPSLDRFELPSTRVLHARLDDGRWLSSDLTGGPYVRLDLATGDEQVLFGGSGQARVQQDGIEVADVLGCCQFLTRNESPLWFVPWDGAPQLLARRVTGPYDELPDGRVLTTVDLDADWIGSLVVVDPDTLGEQLVDAHAPTRASTVDDDGELIYAVMDGDRTGVWLTRVADSP